MHATIANGKHVTLANAIKGRKKTGKDRLNLQAENPTISAAHTADKTQNGSKTRFLPQNTRHAVGLRMSVNSTTCSVSWMIIVVPDSLIAD